MIFVDNRDNECMCILCFLRRECSVKTWKASVACMCQQGNLNFKFSICQLCWDLGTLKAIPKSTNMATSPPSGVRQDCWKNLKLSQLKAGHNVCSYTWPSG